MQEQGSVALDFASVAQHGRWYGRDGLSETLVPFTRLYTAFAKAWGAYLSPSALPRPLHASSRTARFGGRRGRLRAKNRHPPACDHPVRSLWPRLLAVRAEARAGAVIFDIAHCLTALSKTLGSCSRSEFSYTV